MSLDPYKINPAADSYSGEKIAAALENISEALAGAGPDSRVVTVSDTPPEILFANTLWIDTTDFTTYLIYDDGTSVQPVQIATIEGIVGADGLGWTGGSYDPATGVVTFTSDDGLEFSTGDLRGADGAVGGQGLPVGGTTNQVLAKASGTDYDTEWVDQTGGSGAVDSVNTQTGVVVLDADDIDDTATTNKFATAAQLSAVDALGTASTAAIGDFATAAQGTLADSATQPGDLGTLAAQDDIAVPGDITATGTPDSSTFLRGDGQWATPAGGGGGDLLAANNLSDVANAATALSNLGGATAAQGALADSASQATGVEDNADVTDTANVTAAGALMDSEVTNLAQVKAFDSADYATAAQGALADTALQSNAVDSVNTQTGVVVLDADDIDDAATTNKFVSDTEVVKLGTIETGATATPSIRYATKAGTVTNADVLIRSQGPSGTQTVELQYVPHDSAATLLATITVPTTAGIVACPVFSQAMRVVTDGNGSITAADGIRAAITAGPTLPPPIITFA